MAHRNWTRDELLLALNLYCRTAFGRLHRNNPDIIALAQQMGRTPSALAMKLVNLASFDPYHRERKISGLRNASQADREIWEEFYSDPERMAFESQQVLLQQNPNGYKVSESVDIPEGPTAKVRLVRTRLVQSFFRDAVLVSYDNRCAICSLNLIELLSASHIIPWSHNVHRRADPRNGLALCAIHDRAFDRGLITLDDGYCVVLSSRLKKQLDDKPAMLTVAFLQVEGAPISLPSRFTPDPAALDYHRHNIYKP